MTQPEMRVTAYAYVHAHGLMQWYGTLDVLAELGYRAAGEARWQGIEPMKVPEGDLLVHTWPERVWAGAILSMQRSPERRRPATAAPNPPRPENPGYTRVVHCQRDAYDVLIDRSTPWGNPYRIGPDGDRDAVIAGYEGYLQSRPDLLARLGELRGKCLGCWCAPEACHGDVLAMYADNSGPPTMTGQQVLAKMTAAAQRYRALTDAAISNLGQPPNSNPGIPDWWDPSRYDARPGSGYNSEPYDDTPEWNPGWPPMSSEDM